MINNNEEKIGDLINKFNNLEIFINHIFMMYFAPSKNEKEFYEILLNGSVIGFGQKIKVLANMKDFDIDNSIHYLTELSSIRNAVAHNNPYIQIRENLNPMEEITAKHLVHKIDVMNSSGKIKTKDFEDEYNRFNDLLDKLIPNIAKFNSKISSGNI